ncbi:MAG: hypothetical protein K2X37_13860 [Chitinophagaceae bacterium]|jgi:putative oxidoreductase|nr:hypothetical protein [Chitinophagaceae bacterium]
MKNKYYLLAITLFIAFNACVQKTYKRIVVVELIVKGKKDIQTVGIRGNGKPLSWDTDLPLAPVVKDSLYRTTITAVTGYKFAECKFTVNGEFELNNKPDRRVEFNEGDTTFFKAVFNEQ